MQSMNVAILAIFIVQISALPRIKRQGFSWSEGPDDFALSGSTSTRSPQFAPRPQQSNGSPGGTTTTTPPPELSACIRRCPTTPEYNPVCGTNRVTYNNPSALRCANSCGQNVRRAFGGTCQPL